MTYCTWCGEWFTPDNEHPYQKFCRTEHRKKYDHKQENIRRSQKRREKFTPCPFCGTPFSPSKEHLKYCSDMCSSIAYVLNIQERHKTIVTENKGRIRNCKYCGREFNTKVTGRSKYDTDKCYFLDVYGHEEPREIVKNCEYCGKEYPTRISKSIACCHGHTRRLNKIRRKARMRSTEQVHYSRFGIFQRDNFICYICGRPLNMDAVAPQWDSPSIDHVVALSNGGNDTPSNVKAAHFLCNTIKSNRQ